MDDDGSWVIEGPPSDPAADRQFKIAHLQEKLNATWPDGTPAYTAEARASAAEQLKELEAANG